MLRNGGVAERLVAFQEGLSSIKLIRISFFEMLT
jgi:hypothetical protein